MARRSARGGIVTGQIVTCINVSCIVISFYTFAFIQVFSVNLVQTLKTICLLRNTEKLVKVNNQVVAAA